MISNLNNNPKKKLLFLFLVNFIVFYLVNKLGHYSGFLEGKQTLAAELLYASWMGIFMTAFLDWKTIKSLFSKKKPNEA